VTVVECRCTTLTELNGVEAGHYVTGHVKADCDAYVCSTRADAGRSTTTIRCRPRLPKV
jgi:hypothetical protein